MIGLLQDRSHTYKVALNARPNVTAFAFLSSSVNPLLYVFAGSSHIRRAGLGFMAKLFEGTYSENSVSGRRSTTTSTGSSILARFAARSVRSGSVPRNKSFAEDGGKEVKSGYAEELKTLTTSP